MIRIFLTLLGILLLPTPLFFVAIPLLVWLFTTTMRHKQLATSAIDRHRQEAEAAQAYKLMQQHRSTWK